MADYENDPKEESPMFSWNGVDVIPFSGNLVARKDVYVDSMSFLRALGFRQVEP